MVKQVINDVTEPVINKAAVIDDAFDDVEENEILLQNFLEFYQEVEDQFNIEIHRLNIDLPDWNDWDDSSPEFLDFLRKLWHFKTDQPLAAILKNPKLFEDKLGKFEELNQVCKNLKSQNFEVETFDSSFLSTVDLATLDHNYIFIDYNLGIQNGKAAQNHAKYVISRIYESYPENERPVTVLMSSYPNINELAEKFKTESGLLEGVFRSTPKADLSNDKTVSLLTKAYNEAFYCNHTLQEYINSFVEAALKAQKSFSEDVRRLNVEDYEFIQNSVLNSEQHPLGDYLAWLYGSHWTNLLSKDENLKAMQVKIDKVFSTKTPFHSTKPSHELAGIFMSALFEDSLDKLTAHPLHGVTPSVLNLPYLHLGDLFTKSNSKLVYLIINPQCDLERPRLSTKDMSILLLPGSLQPLDSLVPNVSKTDFFLFEEKRYQIFWELKQVLTVPYTEFQEWVLKKKLERTFRLRLPFALELQQKFTSTISRVGLPVSPPMTQNISLKVNFRHLPSDDTETIVKVSDKYAFLPLTRAGGNKPEKIRFTLEFALRFKEALAKKENELKELNAGENVKPKNLVKTIQKTTKFIEEFDEWFFKTRSFNAPTSEKADLMPGILSVIKEDAATDKILTPFWISVIEKVDDITLEEELDILMPQRKNTVSTKTIFRKAKAAQKRSIKEKESNGTTAHIKSFRR